MVVTMANERRSVTVRRDSGWANTRARGSVHTVQMSAGMWTSDSQGSQTENSEDGRVRWHQAHTRRRGNSAKWDRGRVSRSSVVHERSDEPGPESAGGDVTSSL